MSNALKGKVALITGGGTGIGASCARLFALEGATVVVMGRRPEPLEAIASEIEGIAIAGDAANHRDCERAVNVITNTSGRLDILISSAGIMREGNVTDMTQETWRQVMDANLNTVMQIARASIPAMVKSSGGAIVNVASLGALVAPGNMAAYIASKTAVIGLTRSMAVDYGPLGIRVNTLCPGWVLTPMSKEEMDQVADSRGITPQAAIDHATRYLPLGRMAAPIEIARCARFLASEDASFVTGAVLVADGGSQAVDVGYVSLED